VKIQKGIASINDTQTYFEIAGEGRCLTLVHGNTMDTRVWDQQFGYFAEHYRVLRYDLRGCGKSEEPTSPYAFDRDLKSLLDYLSIEQTAVLGISVGGGIALNFTLNYPEKVYALVAVDPFMTGFAWPQISPMTKNLIDNVKHGNAEKAREIWRDMPWFDHVKKNAAVYQVLSEIVQDNSGWFFEKGHVVDWGKTPISERLAEISVPTLAVVGDHDTDDNKEVVGILASGISNARTLTVPDAGHMVMMENPGFFNKHVLKFLRSIIGGVLRI
jgi:3-oxoadipate enol-lactonase